MDKKELRKHISSLRKGYLSSAGSDSISGRLLGALEEMPEFRASETLLLYASLPDEVPTAALMSRFADVKRIALPVVKGDFLELRQYFPGKVNSGYRGIIEPDDTCPVISPSDVDFALVPGVAFTMNGKRLGRGGGFYDRMMGQLGCVKVAVAVPCQILDDIPTDEWDMSVDKVVCL